MADIKIIKYAVGTCFIKNAIVRTKGTKKTKGLDFLFEPIMNRINDIVLSIKEWCSTVGLPDVGDISKAPLNE